MREKILIAEDEREIADLVELYLLHEDFEVIKCLTGGAAIREIEAAPFDLAILDIMLPDISGLDICRKIRESRNYPIIMLTAKDAEPDKITGLTFGADDYVTKPFRPLELMARVKAQLRRYKKYNETPSANSMPNNMIVCAGLTLDTDAFTCRLDGEPLALTPTEFAILRILCAERGKVVSAERLFREVWADEYYTKNSNTVTVHIRHLREKMGDSAENPGYIKTVWGVGYKIEK